jgi:hypothetical protein
MVLNWLGDYRGLPHSNQEPCKHHDSISRAVIVIQYSSVIIYVQTLQSRS